jgi:hypothetical protein
MARPKSYRLIFTGILTLITILVWTGFETHHQLTQSQQLQVDPQILKPLDPRLDTQVLDQIQAHTNLSEQHPLGQPLVSPSPSPSPSPPPNSALTPTPPSGEDFIGL